MNKKAAAAVALAAGLGFAELYRFVFFRYLGILKVFDSKTHADEYYRTRDRLHAEMLSRPHIHYTMQSRRGKTLAGNYYCCGDKPCGKIAFIVHGYRSDGAQTAGPFAEYYFSRGWDIFCPDHAAHGGSSGLVIGYDSFESVDCLDWLERLAEEFGGGISVVLHGFSMGGATVLKMSDRVPKTVKFICSDSGFSDAVGIIRPKLGVLYQPMRAVNRLFGGYDIEATDVRPNLKNARVPILFVHGTADPTVPFAMGRELYEMCPTEKDCLFTEGVLHIESIYVVPEEYAHKLDDFMTRFAEKGEK